MRYWCNDYDTYAAKDLATLKAECTRRGIDFDQEDDWHEVSGWDTMWTCELYEVSKAREKGGPYWCLFKLSFRRPLWYWGWLSKLNFPQQKAWYLCSTEW